MSTQIILQGDQQLLKMGKTCEAVRTGNNIFDPTKAIAEK